MLQTIRGRLVGLAALLAIAILAIVGGWWTAFSHLKVNGPVYAEIAAVKDLVADILPPPEYILESYLTATQALAADKSNIQNYSDRMDSLKRAFDDRHSYWKSANIDQGIARGLLQKSYDPAVRFYETSKTRFFPALVRGDRSAAEAAFKDMSQDYETHRLAIDEVVSAADRLTRDTEARAEASETSYKTFVLMLSAFSALSALAVALGLATGIGRRVRHMAAFVAQVRETGDLTLRAPAEGTDELADMAVALNQMLAEIDAIMRATNEVMGRVAANDLSARVTAPAKGAAATLKDNLNRSLEGLSTALEGVIGNVRQVAAATSQASTAIGQISDGAQGQLNAVKQIAVGIEQTARAVEDVSASAQQSSSHAKQAAVLVADGRTRIAEMVEAVNAIAENAKAITKVTEVIGQIASQTNMLSLNAAIEAARAGEAGKGFAVVADQVGKLADHSGRSVNDINALVERADAETERGVDMARVVGDSIDKIAAGSSDSERMANAIAAAMEQQSAAVREIRASVEDLSRIGETNASAAEEITATMVELSRLSDQTRAEVERFRF